MRLLSATDFFCAAKWESEQAFSKRKNVKRALSDILNGGSFWCKSALVSKGNN